MKISLSWILDHIAATKKEIDIPQLVKKFNATTAEIDGVDHIASDLACLYAVRIVSEGQEFEVEAPELAKRFSLPQRKDPSKTSWYLIKKEGPELRWATLADVGSTKDGLVPSLYMTEKEAQGPWRDAVEQEDTIITIDNKAITNRPDLWGHRGVAREMAALLEKELTPEDHFLVDKAIKHFKGDQASLDDSPFSLAIVESESCGRPCRRLAGLYVSQAEYRPSLPWMAVRLARVDSRPIDAFVDMTNYVMCDIGQPMHAFDAERLPNKKISARCAKEGEKIRLLDGTEAKLSSADCVIADGDTPVSIAGVMGGSDSAVHAGTSSLFLESGSFDPTSVRLTAARLKTRTESSARFEKNLDPNQNTQAIVRFLKLLDDADIPYTADGAVMSLGPLMKEKSLEVSHELIQQKIGIPVSADNIMLTLKRLDFGVTEKNGIYDVTVPTFRATKDVTIKEDVVEEVARFVGYGSITPVLPLRRMAAFDTSMIERKRRLKHILAYGLAMHEVQTYAFYDETFIKRLSFDPVDAPRIANPLSEHWQRLVTSLVPNLINCVVTNHTAQETLRFFEVNRVWFIQEKPVESQECAGIWYEHKKKIDFYEGKALVEKVLNALKVSVQWIKPEPSLAVWYDPHQSAELWHEDRIIGRAGIASQKFLSQVLEGDAFLFELDANFLLNVEPDQPTFKSLPKYPTTEQDISVLVPLSVTVAGLESTISHADKHITKVQLVDSFEKPEWTDKKSLTFRFTAADPEGTLDKDAIEQIYKHVEQAVIDLGAEVR